MPKQLQFLFLADKGIIHQTKTYPSIEAFTLHKVKHYCTDNFIAFFFPLPEMSFLGMRAAAFSSPAAVCSIVPVIMKIPQKTVADTIKI